MMAKFAFVTVNYMNNRSSSHGGLIHGLVHHLQTALIVASAIALLHHSLHMLDWLDDATLRLASAVHGMSPSNRVLQPDEQSKMPVVFTINQALYEREFRLTSPLDREKLASIIKSVQPEDAPGKDASGPAMLVVDIDLSPMVGPPDSPKQDALDNALKELVSKGTRLVLAMPFRVKSPELVELKVGWMHKMCLLSNDKTGAPNVYFAMGEAMTSMGQVLKYDQRRPTLGMVAHDLVKEDANEKSHKTLSASKICEALKKEATPQDGRPGTEIWKDALVSSSFSDEALSAIFEGSGSGAQEHGGLEAQNERESLPFNPAYLQYVRGATAPIVELGKLPAQLDGNSYDTTGKAVFLGGSFDRGDQFDAPLGGGAIPGVVIHALIFASENSPIKPFSHIAEFLADIVVGFACALLFQWLWSISRRVRIGAYENGGLLFYFFDKAIWLLVPVVLILLFVGLAFLLVHVLYPKGHWINVGPVMLGVAAKFLLARISSGEEAQELVHAKPQPRLHARLDWSLVLVLVAITLMSLLRH